MVKQILENESNFHTICERTNCPNKEECFAHKAATFMILGDICTRACSFCAVAKGMSGEVDPQEPEYLAEAVTQLDLQQVTIASVTRDDLLHGGAEQFAACIKAIRKVNPHTSVEVIVPDFRGNVNALNIVLKAKPTIFSHNLETVERLFPKIRPIADYQQSLDVLAYAASHGGNTLVKSSVMVGLGETIEELESLFNDLYHSGVHILTIGQYVPPSKDHAPVEEYVESGKFEMLKRIAKGIGFEHVESGPLVRSSCHGWLKCNEK